MRKSVLIALVPAAASVLAAVFFIAGAEKRPDEMPTLAPAIKADRRAPDAGRARICKHPLTLKIGQVDPEFSIDAKALEAALETAVDEWRDATGRSWFEISQSAAITVNLLYDGRQESLVRQAESQARVNDRILRLNSRSAVSKKDQERFNDMVDAWRQSESRLRARMTSFRDVARDLEKRGEVSSGVFELMERERAELIEFSLAVEAERAALQAEIDKRSGSGAEIRNERNEIKLEIEKLRRDFPERTFVEGQHISGSSFHEINIYTYQTPEELHLVLLHELGHALGLEHSETAGAVMNPVRRMGSGDFHLTAADVGAAAKVCQ